METKGKNQSFFMRNIYYFILGFILVAAIAVTVVLVLTDNDGMINTMDNSGNVAEKPRDDSSNIDKPIDDKPSGGDEKPMGIGLGGGNGDPARPGAGENGLVHDRPPSRSQETRSRAGIVSTRQRPGAAGRMMDRASPRRFLSDRAARAMAWAENSVWVGRS